MKERASLRVSRRDLSNDEGFEDIEMDEDGGFESEEGGVELGNIAMTREKVAEFLHRNDNDITVEEEEIAGDTVFVHVGGQPRHFLMSFVVHKTVMTKEVLACMLDTHFTDESPMVLGCDQTWLVMMGSDECTNERWVEAALNWVDFDLNVLSELSEERSDEDSEEI